MDTIPVVDDEPMVTDMPRMGGVELCRRLKEDPSTRDIVVLLMTARRPIDLGEFGAAGLIHKPFDLVNLVEVVHQHLGATPLSTCS